MREIESKLYKNYRSPDLKEIKATLRMREIKDIDIRIAEIK